MENGYGVGLVGHCSAEVELAGSRVNLLLSVIETDTRNHAVVVTTMLVTKHILCLQYSYTYS